MTSLVLIGMVFVINLYMFPGRMSLNSASAAASELCEWVQVGIDVYILHRKYQVKPSSQWFSAAFAAATDHRNHFFLLYQQSKSFESKVKFRQASNFCKSVLEAAKLAYAAKTKVSITFKKTGCQGFWRVANRFLNKVKSAIPSLFNCVETDRQADRERQADRQRDRQRDRERHRERCCLLPLIIQHCLQKTFLITLILMTRVSFYLFFLLELI